MRKDICYGAIADSNKIAFLKYIKEKESYKTGFYEGYPRFSDRRDDSSFFGPPKQWPNHDPTKFPVIRQWSAHGRYITFPNPFRAIEKNDIFIIKTDLYPTKFVLKDKKRKSSVFHWLSQVSIDLLCFKIIFLEHMAVPYSLG